MNVLSFQEKFKQKLREKIITGFGNSEDIKSLFFKKDGSRNDEKGLEYSQRSRSPNSAVPGGTSK